MKVYETKDIRNVGVVGHGDSGKTTLTAGLLFTAGASNRLLRVDEGNTITDFDEEEIQRKITISTAIAVAEWKKTKINILDTPGYNIFINDHSARQLEIVGESPDLLGLHFDAGDPIYQDKGGIGGR